MIRNTRPLIELVISTILLASGAAAVEKPNVIYMLSDTHRWGAMSFTQTPQVRTPNLDTLRRQGVSFNRCYANLPLCTPYRALMMTGRWPYQQGLIANHMKLAERVDMPAGRKTRGTLAWAFKDAGYRTAHIGKWHLGGLDARPFGFDKSIVWAGTNNHTKSRYSEDGAPLVRWTGRFNATATTKQALDWIARNREGSEPLFLVISLNPPHGPFNDAPAAKKDLYPGPATLPFHPLDKIRNWEQHRDYHALISGIDDEVKRVINKLDELGIAEDTILIYTSDHGGMSGVEGAAYGQKRNPHDESARVPFLIRWPNKIPAGVELDTLFSSIDIFPTLAGLAGLRHHLAEQETREAKDTLAYLQTLPGNDLSKNIRGIAGGPDPDSVFLMHPSNMNNRGSRHEIIFRSIVTKRYSYAVTDKGEYALWDNSEDYQRTNLVHDPATLEIRRKLWSEIREWMHKAEEPYLDNWFASAAEGEIKAWTREHGFGDDNPDRKIGRSAVFDIEVSRPAPE